MDDYDDLSDAYEDALIDETVEEIRERVEVEREELEGLDEEDFADRLAEFAGYPLAMNVRFRFVEFVGDTVVAYEITGLNPI